MKVTICQSGNVYSLQNDKGESWMGINAANVDLWEKPKEPGADVPCWITTDKNLAFGVAYLIEIFSDKKHPLMKRLQDC